ncbi:MAG: hypothetical protein COX77_03340 [Candidatus Komeilibacteria bacterium CG_4_10_14_0_2_um_filter_37_10]|uniref:Uncharacterized protein n=1 Tax=Candidatus Komeilibacteria bacterium CG_4_10_14_0_2_um_filter_37_10 TaxID=1974470 RepID=A0A2M7VEA8_9BACT|nr:MAG: hypothetical protein COX77_03340 [Candidatus Komeilibacteria bacterium CG_4_10_14_0_2_um_filter_37_10]PJA94138.1 MAG: hypothetical protein CO133_00540 [Candidatus Komeilibacteria bacterium CG_4_9_14_3_um_filter_37_5]
MLLSVEMTLEPNEKRIIWQKLIPVFFMTIIFAIHYSFFNDTILGLLVASSFAAVFFSLAVIRNSEPILGVIVMFFYIVVGVWVIITFELEEGITMMLISLLATCANIATVANFRSNEKYKVSSLFNLATALLQFILLWLGLYCAQHLQITWH